MKNFIIKFLICFISLGTLSVVYIMIDNYSKQISLFRLAQDNVSEDTQELPNDEQMEEPTEEVSPSNNIKPITYSCPKGYNLNGTKCTITVAATYTCPDNTHDYSNDGIPRDTYCVNLSEGYYTEDTCPSGYGLLAEISLGSPTKYKCMPLHKKIYVCNSGYILNGTKCTKTINANKS